MAIRKIITEGDPILTKSAREIIEITDRIREKGKQHGENQHRRRIEYKLRKYIAV